MMKLAETKEIAVKAMGENIRLMEKKKSLSAEHEASVLRSRR